MTLTQLKKELGIDNRQILEALSPHFPKFSKSALSMANNEEDYGLTLCPEAEAILRRTYGKPKRLFLWGVSAK